MGIGSNSVSICRESRDALYGWGNTAVMTKQIKKQMIRSNELSEIFNWCIVKITLQNKTKFQMSFFLTEIFFFCNCFVNVVSVGIHKVEAFL